MKTSSIKIEILVERGSLTLLVAEDLQGQKQIASLEAEEHLRTLSKAKQIRCPHCGRRVIYHAGKVKIPHFNHEPHVECTYSGEGETQEHLNGKLIIYNWLKGKYPAAQVELEYRIVETNQIADVYAAFPNGQKIAFEIQCAIISKTKWIERSLLYKEANIFDFWLWGKNYFNEKEEKREKNTPQTVKLKLRDLLVHVNRRKKYVCFLDVQTKEFNQIGNFLGLEKESTTVFSANLSTYKVSETLINKAKILGDLHTHSKYKEWCLRRTDKVHKLLTERRQKKEQLRLESEKRELQEKIFEENKRAYMNYLNSFDLTNIMSDMTSYEKNLFQQLLEKHNYNNKNFPGIFKIFFEKSLNVRTPYPLWQLWIYDQYIYSNKKPTVWTKKIYPEFKKKFSFHYSYKEEVFGLILRYLSALSDVGMLKSPFYSYKPYKINWNIAPIINDFKMNSYIAYGLSSFGGFSNLNDLSTKQKFFIVNAIKEYERLVALKSDSPAQIDSEFIPFVNNALEKDIYLSPEELTFINAILKRVKNNLFVTQVEYDTCCSLISDRLQFPF